MYDYAQTKSAQVAFTKSPTKRLAKKGIAVNALAKLTEDIAPSLYLTPLQVSGSQSHSTIVKFGGNTPIGCQRQPAKLAHYPSQNIISPITDEPFIN
ncbi:hypothetical protein [Nostoc sp. MS1]|uniref:hypothetical protein n=1 Tax=Nostoc sp. MS1 TaxID=2764711 RepID=UPI001CC66C7C|nr:hypothetical protein [Nostoc sp. MS1]BCL38204.1 hypothetical protein NSMS1_46510 [Nostoc sp. MS1]